MIEVFMYLGAGFLAAALLVGCVITPLVHARAVRLTMKRLEAATPLSMAEIQADKDQLRAEFAMSTRRLELSVEQMKAKTTSQLAELGKKSEAINRLKLELGEKTATIFALEAREKAMKDQLRDTEEEFSVKTGSLRHVERSLADKEAELAKLTSDLDERSVVADSQRVELVALRTQVDALKDRVQDAERQVEETRERLARERTDADEAGKELADERGRVENLGSRVGQLERQLIAQTTEAEILGRRVQELENRLADQSRLLAEREYHRDQLRADLATAQRVESDLRAELAEAEGRHRAATESLRAEKALIEEQLTQARDERSQLQREITSMRRDAESSWAAERVENALLRERINDVAAEVARLAVALEGPGSPIETILANETARRSAPSTAKAAPAPTANGNGNGAGANGSNQAGGNLADRIRALQSRASRVPPVS
jgi:chromosome segregation ATPase